MDCSIHVAQAAMDVLGRLSDGTLVQLQERLLVAARLTPLRSPVAATSFWVAMDSVTAFCGLDFAKRALVVHELFPSEVPGESPAVRRTSASAG